MTDDTAKPKRGRFDETAVKDLSEFVRAQPQGEIDLAKLDSFYEKYPQHKSVFSGRISKVAEAYPQDLILVKHGKGSALLRAVDNAIQECNIDEDDDVRCNDVNKTILDEAVSHLISYLKTYRPDGQLPLSEIETFYARHSAFNNCFTGKLKILARQYSDKIAIEGGNRPFLRLVTTPPVQETDRTNFSVEEEDHINLTIESLKSSTKVIVDVDGDYSTSTLTCIIVASVTSYIVLDIRDGVPVPQWLWDILSDEHIEKICFSNFDLGHFLSFSEHRFANMFDIVASYRVLFPESSEDPTLCDIVSDYGLVVELTDSNERPSNVLRPGRGKDLLLQTRKSYELFIDVLFKLHAKLKEEAYSQCKEESCRKASLAIPNDATFLKLLQDDEAVRLFKTPVSRTALESEGLARSIKTRMAAARRRRDLLRANLPPDACVEFLIRTTGFCSKGDKCKFSHALTPNNDC